MLLSLQVFSVSLRTGAGNLAYVAVMELLWFRRGFRTEGFSAGAAAAFLVLPTSFVGSAGVGGAGSVALLGNVHRRGGIEGGVVTGIGRT